MKVFLFKPLGTMNYLVINTPEDIQKFFDTILPGDIYNLRVLELSEEEYNALDNFDSFDDLTSDNEISEESIPNEEPIVGSDNTNAE